MGPTLSGRVLVAAGAALICFSIALSVLAGGAGATAGERGSYSCSYRAIKVTQAGSEVSARGRLSCIGSGVKAQVLRVCLLQADGSRHRMVKCVTRRREGPGLFTAAATRRCDKGPDVGFITRISIRVRLDTGGVQSARSESSDNEFPRNCG